MLDVLAMLHQCAPDIHHSTMQRIVQVESGYNPYAIGVVGSKLEKQPTTLEEGIATAKKLEAKGFNYSVGLAQVNKKNFGAYGLSIETAFEPCANLRAGSQILLACYERAYRITSHEQYALRDAFSCYYSGNFKTGYDHGYVAKVEAIVPALKPLNTDTPPPSRTAKPKQTKESVEEAIGKESKAIKSINVNSAIIF